MRKAASTCQFRTLTDELIGDRLVIGLQDHSTKLYHLKEESLDLNKALNICKSSEVGSQQLKARKIDDKKGTEEVHWRAMNSEFKEAVAKCEEVCRISSK